MAENELIELFDRHEVKPTANRLIIAKTLLAAGRPMSLVELEAMIDSIDKSGVFRTLMLFREHHLV
ncbi:MAG: transcriptional repressor, partial [Bacteroidales bacterium]|nr:transcriptional repressor [Bacteroidales bacterium]